MATYKTKGIILKRKDIGEADRLITVFSDKDGKIKARAKGVRRILSRNGGSIEIFTFADFIFAKGKTLDVLVSATTIDCFKNIKQNLKKTAIAYYFSELIDKMTEENENSSKIFLLLLESFKFLDSNKDYFSLLCSYFELNLLSFEGYSPQLDICIQCHHKIKPNRHFFSNKFGGILCPDCQITDKNAIEISINTLKTMKIILKYNLPSIVKIKIDSKTQEEVKIIIENFLKYVAEKEFKSPKFIKKIDELDKVV